MKGRWGINFKRKYILEFSEEQQCFNLNDGRNEPNTNGWVTVFEHISEDEIVEFQKTLKWEDEKRKYKRISLDFVKAKAAKWDDYR